MHNTHSSKGKKKKKNYKLKINLIHFDANKKCMHGPHCMLNLSIIAGMQFYKCQRETSIWSLNITFLKKNVFKSQDPKAFSRWHSGSPDDIPEFQHLKECQMASQ